MRCATVVSLALLAASATAQAAGRVSVAVFTLFKPARLVVRADAACTLNGRLLPAGGVAEIGREPVVVESPDRGSTAFTLSVPGKIARAFHGTLRTVYASGVVTAIVTMDLETAVAAALDAEMPANAPDEALSAMAIAIRSYYASGPRHSGFDFCDTTHCQFHRSPVRVAEAVRRAVERTHGLVVTFDGETFAPYYSAACGGRTWTPSDVRLPSGRYPYQRVECPFCRRYEPSWRREIPYAVSAALAERPSEPDRLAVARTIGWSKVPQSNNYTVRRDGPVLIFVGSGSGHGVGICQRGAMGMARAGASWREILDQYLPGAAVRLRGMQLARLGSTHR